MQTTLKELPLRTKAKERLQAKRWTNLRNWNKATKKSRGKEGILEANKDTLIISMNVVLPILYLFGALYYREAQQMKESLVSHVTPINLSELEEKEEPKKKAPRPKYYESAFDLDEEDD